MWNWTIGGGMGIWMFFNMIFWILVIVGIVLLAVSIARTAERGEHPKVEESALDILKKRYARGEINKEEYEEKKRDIS